MRKTSRTGLVCGVPDGPSAKTEIDVGGVTTGGPSTTVTLDVPADEWLSESVALKITFVEPIGKVLGASFETGRPPSCGSTALALERKAATAPLVLGVPS